MDRAAQLDALIIELEKFTPDTGSFHSDRELADRILIADGWQCEPDSNFEGGGRWWFGTNPQYSTGETTRPHPINDLGAAYGVIPYRAEWTIKKAGSLYEASVYGHHDHPTLHISRAMHNGRSKLHTVAILIAAFRYIRANLPPEAPSRATLEGFKHDA